MKLITRFNNPFDVLNECIKGSDSILILSGPAQELMALNMSIAIENQAPAITFDFIMRHKCIIGYKLMYLKEDDPKFIGLFANRIWMSGGLCLTRGQVN